MSSLEQQGIIEKVDGPTPWVSPLVVTPKKDGNVRICVDLRMANRAIKRERHPMPTMDDLTHTLNGASFLKAGSPIGISSAHPCSRDSIHYHIRYTQRSLEIQPSQFWHQLSYRNLSEGDPILAC